MPLEEDVKQDVRKWSELFLEVPNQHLGGYPACPFAKKTWADNKVLVEVKRKHKWYKSELNGHIQQLDFSVHELLIFCDPYFNYSLEEFQNVIDEYNTWYNKKDIFFMGFHPHNPANEEEQEFLVTPNGNTPIVEDAIDYSMMLEMMGGGAIKPKKKMAMGMMGGGKAMKGKKKAVKKRGGGMLKKKK